MLRENANLIVLFRQDAMNLKHVFSDHVCPDMTFQQFKEACGTCWKRPFGYFVIDKECDIKEGRYRRGFTEFGSV